MRHFINQITEYVNIMENFKDFMMVIAILLVIFTGWQMLLVASVAGGLFIAWKFIQMVNEEESKDEESLA